MNTIATEVELEALVQTAPDGRTAIGSPMPFLESVPVKLSVRLGQAQLSVAELVALQHGAVLALDAMVDQPLDILVSSHVVARGNLVAVGDHFGVRICDVADAGSRSHG